MCTVRGEWTVTAFATPPSQGTGLAPSTVRPSQGRVPVTFHAVRYGRDSAALREYFCARMHYRDISLPITESPDVADFFIVLQGLTLFSFKCCLWNGRICSLGERARGAVQHLLPWLRRTGGHLPSLGRSVPGALSASTRAPHTCVGPQSSSVTHREQPRPSPATSSSLHARGVRVPRVAGLSPGIPWSCLGGNPWGVGAVLG